MNNPKTAAQRLVEYYSSRSVIQNLPTTNCKQCNVSILEPYDTCLECEQMNEEDRWNESKRCDDDSGDNNTPGFGDDV